jgi:hypothetical protein
MSMTLQQIARFVPLHILPPQFYVMETAKPNVAPDPLFMDLSGSDVKARCELWGLAQVRGRKKNADGAMGRGVVWNKGLANSSPIVGIDPKLHRVLTQTGAVYELGQVVMMFCVQNPEIMAELGFGSTKANWDD